MTSPTASNKRQHQRVPVSNPATLELRTQSSVSLTTSTQRRNVPVTLRDASVAGLSIEAIAEAIDKGSTISVKLQIGLRTITLPAQVVWSKRDADGVTSFAGVRIHLAVTDATTRKAWEGFVNEQAKSAPAPRPAAPEAPAGPRRPSKTQERAAKLFDDLFKK